MKKIEKLIKEYKNKIDLCDFLIEAANDTAKSLRNALTQSEVSILADACEERRIAKAQRQIYVQFIADLDSLLD